MVVRRQKIPPKKKISPIPTQSKMFIIYCGIGIVLSSFVILGIWYSEYKYVRNIKITNKLTNRVIHGKQSPIKSQENKLILVNGHFNVENSIVDPYIKTGPWLKIYRKIEYYPWKQSRGKKNLIKYTETTAKKSKFAMYPGFFLYRRT